jgi:hypothetical protein
VATYLEDVVIFSWILILLAIFLALFAAANWWTDERDKKSGIVTRPSMPLVSSATPLHPSIDPYLAELREYLLQDPLPQGPGEMAERVYQHLTQWVNIHLTEDALHNVDLEGELLVEPTSGYVDISRNDPVLPSGQVENITDVFQ